MVYCYFEDYRDTMICVTVLAVASLAITNGTLKARFQELYLFLFIGIIISLIGNKIILSDYEEDKLKNNL